MRNTSLIDILRNRKDTDKGITFIETGGREVCLSYKALYHAALERLALLQGRGLLPGDELVLQVEDSREFLVCFWACILGAIIPVPLSVGQNDEHRQKLFNVWKTLNNPYLVISEHTGDKLSAFAALKGQEDVYAGMKDRTICLNEDGAFPAEGKIATVREDDIAFIQFSSGSTGAPKGVMLTHRNLVANMSAISEASAYTGNDSMLSWMPLTHDMGLIGFHLNPMFCGMDQYIMPVSLFIRRPSLWLEKASEHKISILCSPNFGYEYALRYCRDEKGYDWDLSQVRIIYNGAEPISARLCAGFTNWLQEYGLDAYAMRPVYGLAEASLAVSISKLHEEVMAVSLDRRKLNVGERADMATESSHAVSFVNVGKPVSGCALVIVNNEGTAVAEGTIGHVHIKGDSITSGYYNNTTETEKVISKEGWLRTGDIGFILNGAVYITGRSKDIIPRNGQNYYSLDIERVAEAVEGIELNKIAVTGFFNDHTQREEIIGFVFHRGNIADFLPLMQALKLHISACMGFEIDRVIPVKHIPRTTSGKLQRFRLLEQFRMGEFDAVEAELERLMQAGAPSGVEILNDTEAVLLNMWRKVFSSDDINLAQNFFETGGDSLKMIALEMMLLKEFGVSLPQGWIYENQTIRQQAAGITRLERKGYNPIPAAPAMQYFPLSLMQKGIYYSWEVDKTATAYNIPVAIRIQGELIADRLADGITLLADRHEILRASCCMQQEPVLRINDRAGVKLETEACGRDELNERLQGLVQPFDLTKAPLFRAKLLRLDDQEHVLFLDFSHIISDGLSVYLFIAELFGAYQESELPGLSTSYTDYIHWERERLSPANMAIQRQYWLDQLSGTLPVLELPTDLTRPAIFNTKGEKLLFELSPALVAQIRAFARERNCTLHTFLFAVYNLLLARYTGQHDIITGIPVAGRKHPDLQKMQGMFVNNLAVRTRIASEISFSELLEQVKSSMDAALQHQDYPFSELVREVQAQRDMSRNPVFDTMFLYQSSGFPQPEGIGLAISQHLFDPGFSKFDLTLEISDNNGAMQYGIEYATKLFRRETIQAFAESFESLLKAVITAAEKPLWTLPVIGEQPLKQCIETFNDTAVQYQAGKTIVELFEAQARLSPDNTVIEYEDISLTYRELNEKASQLALFLKEKGVGRNSIVGVCQKRSPALIVSLLAILKACGCYLPIDAGWPLRRVELVIKNSRCGILLTDQTFAGLSGPEIIHTESLKLKPAAPADIPAVNTATDLAYIIYTSGTTGVPKGVMISHQSLVNYICWAAEKYVGGDAAAFPLYTSISFDLTVTSIFTPLITGNKIIIYEEDGRRTLLESVIADNKANIVKLTPSHLRLMSKCVFPAAGTRIKKLIVGGEALSTGLAADIYNKFGGDIEIYNEYGPTEATVGCMIHRFDPREELLQVPIGVPAANTQIYVLDKYLQPVPRGAYGELYISGDGLAQGYLFNEELTNSRFIPHPFIAGRKMYKTGDMARWLPGGIIAFGGRYDQQVKINGYRVELAEITDQLIMHPVISEAVVITKTGKWGLRLCAYYKAAQGQEEQIDEATLREYLALYLPYYMIPVHFTRLENIPLTKNGKVDNDALPEPDMKDSHEGLPLRMSDVEAAMLEVWKDVLSIDEVSITDNFFELGGDSIKAVQIISRLFDKGISLTVRDILSYQAIRQISGHASAGKRNNGYEQNVLEGERGMMPIESWFFEQGFGKPAYYNQSVLLQLKREMDIALLEEAFNLLIAHHDGLRTNYDPARQRLFYNPAHLRAKFAVEQLEIPANDQANMLLHHCERIKGSLDLGSSCLLKAALIREAGSGLLLFITAHHLLMDGVSWRILLEDLYTVYSALETGLTVQLSPKTASLRDFSNKLTEYQENEAAYWARSGNSGFTLPLDMETTDWRTKHQGTITELLDEKETRFLLREANTVYGTDTLVLLSTALMLALREWIGKDRFVIEMESHGRNLEGTDTSRTLGWFTAMYPVELEWKDAPTGRQIQHIKESLRSIPSGGIGYGIHQYLRKSSDSKHKGPVPLRFNYLGHFGREFSNDLFTVTNRFTGAETDPGNHATAVIEIIVMIIDEKLQLSINYNRTAHKRATVQLLKDRFFYALNLILSHIRSEDNIYFTPSDFDSVDLDNEELNALFS